MITSQNSNALGVLCIYELFGRMKLDYYYNHQICHVMHVLANHIRVYRFTQSISVIKKGGNCQRGKRGTLR